ncbi:hypothetical protein [Pseudokordiimonas caeni]|uniref:hypothetical protein n=1 Tax=Pseudokordiimonas caeni TaxID=2997908 RepID=UPI002810D6F8|nr:hypothetical protein [Pseudokordiimonas caeni]
MLAKIALVVILTAILAAAGAWSFDVVSSLQGGAGLSTHGYIAAGLGIFFSCLIGFGLMALLFYSARHGHDEASHKYDLSSDETAGPDARRDFTNKGDEDR